MLNNRFGVVDLNQFLYIKLERASVAKATRLVATCVNLKVGMQTILFLLYTIVCIQSDIFIISIISLLTLITL